VAGERFRQSSPGARIRRQGTVEEAVEEFKGFKGFKEFEEFKEFDD
jgi:hypothetical protein